MPINGNIPANSPGGGEEFEGDATARGVDVDHTDSDAVAEAKDVGDGVHPPAETGDVDEAVLLDAEVDKRSEGCDVVDHTGQSGTDRELREVADGGYEFLGIVVDTRIAAGLAQLGDDVGHGLPATDTFRHETVHINAVEQRCIAG